MTDVIMIGAFPDDPTFIKGGVQASVYGLAHALRKRSDVGSVRIVAIPSLSTSKTPNRTANVEGMEVTYLNVPYKLLLSSLIHLPAILRDIKRCQQPVVHVHGTGPLQTAIMAIMRLKRLPLVWTLHGITEKETLMRYKNRPSAATLGRYWFYRYIEHLSLRTVPDIIVDTPYVKTEVHTPNHLYVIPQGIFMQDFVGMTAVSNPPPLILSLGVLVPRKGHHLTLEAFAKIRKTVPSAQLIIAGAPTSPDYYESLKTQAATLGVTDAVEFAVNRPRPEILAMLSKARVMALHSHEESQGIAFCEALAAGVPVVATQVGGIPFVVDEGKDGFLVPYGEVDAYAAAITRLLTDDALHARMSAQARTAAQRFDWNPIAAQVMEIYCTAIGRN